jgi:hypothetical protein
MLQVSELPPVTKFDQSMAGLMIADTQHDPLCNFGQTAPLTNTVEPEASVGTECPKGVNRVILSLRQALPVYPDKRTISEPVRTSRLGPEASIH